MPAPRRRPVRPASRAKREVVQPLPENEDYSDVSGDPGSGFALENEDPHRAYLWAHDSRDSISEAQRGAVPYQIEHYLGDEVPDALRPKGGIGFMAKGDRIMVRDHILMSCDRARLQKRQRYLIKTNRETWQDKSRGATASEKLDRDSNFGLHLNEGEVIQTVAEQD